MKKLWIIALLFASAQCWGEDLSIKDGTIYRNVTIISANPHQMLIIHEGGGCEVAYVDLAVELSEQQKSTVTKERQVYATRKVQQEKRRLEQEAERQRQEIFAQAQRDKGLLLFEEVWMKPVDREELLASRERDQLEKKRQALEFKTQQAELRTAELKEEQERERLSEYEKRNRRSYSTYYPSGHASSCRCSHCYSRRYGQPSSSSLNVSLSKGNSSVYFKTGTSSPMHQQQYHRTRSNSGSPSSSRTFIPRPYP